MKKGFTLIELLVVISIIAFLSSVVLASLSDARAKARDARRQSDIKAIQNALELYYADNGSYPDRTWTVSNNGAWDNSVVGPIGLTGTKDPINEVVSGTLPLHDSENYLYSYYGSNYGCPGQWYMLVYNLETDDNSNPSSPGVTACDGTFFNFTTNGSITVGVSGK